MEKNKRPTQCKRVFDYIKRFGSIDQLQALSDLGVMRLSSRINELKKNGENIVTEMRKGKNRFGETTYYAVYRFADESKGV